MKNENRQPSVSGQFYPADKTKLTEAIECYLSEAKTRTNENVRAIIAPHAGYVYSGAVAASAFNQIDPNKKYENIFVLASSHQSHFSGASVYVRGNYSMPLGEVAVNKTIGRELIEKNEIFCDKPEFHVGEHSLEVEIPFMQYLFKENLNLIPIIIGVNRAIDCKKIADALSPYFNDDNLFVISTDFSHYPSYENAVKNDARTADALILNNPVKFLEAINDNQKLEINNLATSMCGWTSVLTLLYLTENCPELKYNKIHYTNSGEISNDKTRVVGYWAISVTEEDNENIPLQLSDEAKKFLLFVARKAIENNLNNKDQEDFTDRIIPDGIPANCGAFVTIHCSGKLRGCVGRLSSSSSLIKSISELAQSAAFSDFRFDSIKLEELDEIDIEISVLSPMRKIDSAEQFDLEKHGIYIKKGEKSGTFLPQVAKETGWSKEELLGHCADSKVGIGWNGWKDADLYVYEAFIFSEAEIKKIERK